MHLVLNHVKAPTSSKDIRTVNNETHESFQPAAIALKLLKQDRMWIECMKETNKSEANIHRLRQLFVTMLLWCDVSNNKALCEECKHFLHKDYVYRCKKKF